MRKAHGMLALDCEQRPLPAPRHRGCRRNQPTGGEGVLLPLLLLCCAPQLTVGLLAGGFAGASVTYEQRQELRGLLEATKDAVDSLPHTDPQGEEVRLLLDKLTRVQQVVDLVNPAEFDAMLTALVAAKDYGLTAVDGLLARSGEAAGALHGNDLQSLSECDLIPQTPQRRLLMQSLTRAPNQGQHALSEKQAAGAENRRWRGSGHLDDGMPAERTAHGAAQGVASGRFGLESLQRFRRWLLDRPPPWERECDCCFAQCPAEHNCIQLSDSWFLACRGESVGAIIDRQWRTRPAGCTVVVAGIAVLCALRTLQLMRMVISAVLLRSRKSGRRRDRRAE